MRDRLTVSLLGPLTVEIGGRAVPAGGNRVRAMLAALAMEAGRPVPVETLYETVWDDRPPADVRGSLQTTASRLRATLGAEWVATAPGGYELRVDPDDVDAHRLSALVRRARDEPPQAALATLSEAVRLWRGEPLQDIASEVLRQRYGQPLTELWLTAQEQRTGLLLATHEDPSAVVVELRQLLHQQPLREQLWAHLMTALYRAGRQSDALAAYDTVRQLLAEQLGIDPGEPLRRLRQAILVRDPALRPATPPAGATADVPAKPAVVPRQLPGDVPRFTGREAQLARLDALLPDPAPDGPAPVRIAAIHGPGGVGNPKP